MKRKLSQPGNSRRNVKKDKQTESQTPTCLVPRCKFFAAQPPHLCSLHLAESKRDGWKLKKDPPALSTLLWLVPAFEPIRVAGLLQLLLECEQGQNAKRVLDAQYRVADEGHTGNRPIPPAIPVLQKFVCDFVQMLLPIITELEYEMFALKFVENTRQWYPSGMPLLLKVHLQSYSRWVLMQGEEVNGSRLAEVCDVTSQCAHVAYVSARPKVLHLSDDFVPAVNRSMAETEIGWMQGFFGSSHVLRLVIEYAIRDRFCFILE
jgi:hypothetical protein